MPKYESAQNFYIWHFFCILWDIINDQGSCKLTNLQPLGRKTDIMTTLATNWLTEGLIDFEYKKYILMDYLQKVKKKFKVQRIYPFLSQLVVHYKQLLFLHETKDSLQAKFPKNITGIDLERLQLRYEQAVSTSKHMEEIEHILAYALPEIQAVIEIGKEIHEKVESDVHFFPVGLSSLYKKEGYLMIEVQGRREIEIFSYKLNSLYHSKERYVGICMRHIRKEKKRINANFEQLKMRLIRKEKKLAHPATFAASSKQPYPLTEALLPVTKRLLLRHIHPPIKDSGQS